MDACITIRTIMIRGETAYVQAGAGIVADSDPEFEYEESLQKAEALLQAISEAGCKWPVKSNSNAYGEEGVS
jgi:anthranilate synthase component 1